jgi:branched-chain amino acid transport system substrate-binding protein
MIREEDTMSTTSNRLVRWQVISITLLLLVVNLTGCAPSATEAATFPPPSPTVVIPTSIPTETPIPTPTQTPAPTETPFVPKATIKIVLHVPLSGDQSIFGTDIQRAADMAIQELATPLNNMGYKIDLVSFDDQASVDVGVANAKEIVADPDILCGVGHYNSRVMIQASEIYHKEGLAFVSPSNTNPTVTERGYLEVNRVVGRDDGQGIADAQFAKAQNFSTVYIITQDSDITRKIAENFKREADRIGVKVTGMLTFKTIESFDGIVKRMMNLNPDLVYLAGTTDQFGPFIRQARAAGYTGAFLSIDATSALVDLAGPLLIEDGGMYYTSTSAPANYYPDAAKFVEDFDNRYGAAPQIYAAQAYDAAGICMKAIEEASITKGGEVPTREEVANAIRALVDYKGITGTFNFNKKGDPILVDYFVFKVTSVDSGKWDQNPIVASIKIGPP